MQVGVRCPIKEVRSPFSHRNGEIGVLSALMFSFQRDGFHVLEEDIPRSKLAKCQCGLQKNLFTFQREEKVFATFLK